MCEYMIYNENGKHICEPKCRPCTMCVLNNWSTYFEIKSGMSEGNTYGKIDLRRIRKD